MEIIYKYVFQMTPQLRPRPPPLPVYWPTPQQIATLYFVCFYFIIICNLLPAFHYRFSLARKYHANFA